MGTDREIRLDEALYHWEPQITAKEMARPCAIEEWEGSGLADDCLVEGRFSLQQFLNLPCNMV